MKREKQTNEKNLAAPVSFFGCLDIAKPSGKVDIFQILTTEQYAEQVGRLRTAIAQGDTEAAHFIKHSLPAFTPSGIFTYRNKEGLQYFSGYIGIDIDEQDNPKMSGKVEKIRNAIAKQIPYVAYSGLSCSGKGLFLLCRIADDLERWGEYYNLIAEELSHYDIKPDKACTDICRLRFVSYDPEAYINPQAEPLKLPLDKAGMEQIRAIMANLDKRRMPVTSKHPAETTEIAQISTITPKVEQLPAKRKKSAEKPILQDYGILEKMAGIVSVIEAHKIDLTNDYKDWYKIGCAIASAMGEQGRPYFHRISAISPKYERKECERKYTQILKQKRNDYTIATFVWHCNNAGLEVVI